MSDYDAVALAPRASGGGPGAAVAVIAGRRKDVGRRYVRAGGGRLQANLHAQTWKSQARI